MTPAEGRRGSDPVVPGATLQGRASGRLSVIERRGRATQLAGLVHAETAAGRTVHVVPAGADKAESLRLFAEVLRFPAWFGHNYDALADSLGDWADAQPGEWSLIWDRTALLAAAHPDVAATIADILDEIATADPAGRAILLDR